MRPPFPAARPIRLLVVDIDGCLVPVEHATYDLESLARLATFNRRSRYEPEVPPLTILSGRPHPYVDALMQLLDIDLPAVFENGGGLALREPYRALYHEAAVPGRAALRRLAEELEHLPGAFVQPGKSVSLTVFPTQPEEGIERLERELAQLLERLGLELKLDPAQECINLLLPSVDKGAGLRWLAQQLGLETEEVAGIGDSIGDLAWLSLCGVSAAPANADERLKREVSMVSQERDIAATLELYEMVIASNRAARRDEAD